FGPLLRNRGTERTKLFAMLDEAVQIVSHHLRNGRCENTASAEAARSEFHRAAEPADDSSLFQEPRNLRGQLVLSQTILIDELAIIENAFDLIVAELRPQESVPHLVGSFAIVEHLMPHVQRGADRTPGIARRRLHEQSLETRSSLDCGTGETV